MTTNSETVSSNTTIPGNLPYWVRETAYIVNEMLHAIEQSKNPVLTDEQRKGYTMRGLYLRDTARECINNAYNDSNKEENENNE
tara:strand:- start:303 stop:554 length:252 start_codon:yes stop_codon:yes gene_type:complete